MILLVHMLFGAAIGFMINNIPMAIILSLLGHYFLDIFPHVEYLESVESSIKKLKNNALQKNFSDILKVILDFCLGILAIFIFSKNQPIIYIGAFFGILPDGLTIVSFLLSKSKTPAVQELKNLDESIIPALKKTLATMLRVSLIILRKLLSKHDKFHKKIHFLKHKKISNFWRIMSQTLAVIISIIALKS